MVQRKIGLTNTYITIANETYQRQISCWLRGSNDTDFDQCPLLYPIQSVYLNQTKR